MSLAVAIVKSLLGVKDFQHKILEMVHKVALTRSGGFLGGVDRSIINEKELAALNELEAIIGR